MTHQAPSNAATQIEHILRQTWPQVPFAIKTQATPEWCGAFVEWDGGTGVPDRDAVKEVLRPYSEHLGGQDPQRVDDITFYYNPATLLRQYAHLQRQTEPPDPELMLKNLKAHFEHVFPGVDYHAGLVKINKQARGKLVWASQAGIETAQVAEAFSPFVLGDGVYEPEHNTAQRLFDLRLDALRAQPGTILKPTPMASMAPEEPDQPARPGLLKRLFGRK